MRKNLFRFLAALFLIAILFLPLSSSWQNNRPFLAAGVSCGVSTTLVNGTGFTSNELAITLAGYDVINNGLLNITFTAAAGSALTVDFEFQVSYDGGTTWTTAYYVRIQTPTNETAVTNVVRVSKPIYLYGISHIRLYRIVNNDDANNLTVCNASMSL